MPLFSALFLLLAFPSFTGGSGNSSLVNDGDDDGITEFAAGTYILEQSALDDAPERYTKFVQEMVDYMNHYKFDENESSKHSCGSYNTIVGWELYLKEAVQSIELLPVDSSHPNQFLDVTIGENGIIVKANYHFIGSVPIWYKTGTSWGIFGCFSNLLCDHQEVALSFDYFTTSTFDVITDEENQQSINATLVGSTSDPVLDCHCVDDKSWFMKKIYNHFFPIIEKMLDDEIAAIASRYNQVLSVPQDFVVYSDTNSRGEKFNVTASYQLIDTVFNARNSMLIRANSSLRLDYENGDTALYYTLDPVKEREQAILFPPIEFDRTRTVGGKSNVLLSGLRLSTTVFDALMWAADVSGEFDNEYGIKVLDATINTTVVMEKPMLGVPADDQLSLNLRSGQFNSTCKDVDSGQINPVFLFDFSHLTGAASLKVLNEDPWGVSMQVDSFDIESVALHLKAPPLPVPDDVLEDVMRQGLTNSIPTMNKILDVHTLYLPDSVQFWIPNPTLKVVSQNCSTCETAHGYVDLSTFCSCEETNSWPVCSEVVMFCDDEDGSRKAESVEIFAEPAEINIQNRPIVNYLASPSVEIRADPDHSVDAHIWLFADDSADGECSFNKPAQSVSTISLRASTTPQCQWMMGGVVDNAAPLFGSITLVNEAPYQTIHTFSMFCDENCDNCGVSESSFTAGSCFPVDSDFRDLAGGASSFAVGLDDALSCLKIRPAHQSNNNIYVEEKIGSPEDDGFNDLPTYFTYLGDISKTCDVSNGGSGGVRSWGNWNSASPSSVDVHLRCDPTCGIGELCEVDALGVQIRGDWERVSNSSIVLLDSLPSCPLPPTPPPLTDYTVVIVASVLVLLTGSLWMAHTMGWLLSAKSCLEETFSAENRQWLNDSLNDSRRRTVEESLNFHARIREAGASAAFQWENSRARATLVSVGSYGKAKFHKHKNFKGLEKMIILTKEENFPARVFPFLLDFIAWKTPEMGPHERCTYAMGAAFCLSICKIFVWYFFDPYTLFDQDKFHKLGMTPDIFDTSDASAIFKIWQKWGFFSQIAILILIIYSTAKYARTTILAGVLQICVVIDLLCCYVIPPLMYSTKDSIRLVEGDAGAGALSSDDVREIVGSGASLSLTGIQLSFMSYLFLFMVSSLAVPTFLCWMRQFPNPKVGESEEDRHKKVNWLCSLCSLGWILQLTFCMSGVIPVVITYQSLGLQSDYIIFWLILMIVPMIFIFHAHGLVDNLKVRGEEKQFEEGRWWNFIFLLAVYLVCSGFIFSRLVVAISADDTINRFLIITWFLNCLFCCLVAYITTIAVFQKDNILVVTKESLVNLAGKESIIIEPPSTRPTTTTTITTTTTTTTTTTKTKTTAVAAPEHCLHLSLAVAFLANPKIIITTVTASTVSSIVCTLSIITTTVTIWMVNWGRHYDSIYYIAAFGNSVVCIVMTFFWKAFYVEGSHTTPPLQQQPKEDQQEEVDEKATLIAHDDKIIALNKNARGWELVDKYIGAIVGSLCVLILLVLLVCMIGYSDNENFKPFVISVFVIVTVPVVVYALRGCGGGIRRMISDLTSNTLGFILEQHGPKRNGGVEHFSGHRIPGRRLFLVCGTILFIVHTMKDMSELIEENDAAAVFNEAMTFAGYNLTWPAGEPTIFDEAFDLYDAYSMKGLYVELFGAFFLFGATMCDLSNETVTGLRWSRLLLSISLMLMLIAVFATSFPNYLENTDIDAICPTCAPQFDYTLLTLSGNIVGIFCAGVLSFSCFGMLVTMPPAVIRAVALTAEMLCEMKEKGKGGGGTLALIFAAGTFGMPIISCPMFVVLQQTVGDDFTLACILVSWLSSVVIGVLLFVTRVKTKELKYWYLLWLCFYYNSLLILLSRIVVDLQLSTSVWESLQRWDYWVMLLVDYSLANVFLGDIICVLLDENTKTKVEESQKGEGELYYNNELERPLLSGNNAE